MKTDFFPRYSTLKPMTFCSIRFIFNLSNCKARASWQISLPNNIPEADFILVARMMDKSLTYKPLYPTRVLAGSRLYGHFWTGVAWRFRVCLLNDFLLQRDLLFSMSAKLSYCLKSFLQFIVNHALSLPSSSARQLQVEIENHRPHLPMLTGLDPSRRPRSILFFFDRRDKLL